jgi:hypothetical protein
LGQRSALRRDTQTRILCLCTCVALALSGCARTPSRPPSRAPPGLDKAALTSAQAQAQEAAAGLAEVSEVAEAIVFSHPDMGQRYFAFEPHSLRMPGIESVGSRTGGQQAQRFVATGPAGKARQGAARPAAHQRVDAPRAHHR